MQIRPIVRYPYTPVRMAKMKKIGTKCDNDRGRLQLPYVMADGEVAQCWETVWPCLVQLSMQMSMVGIPGCVLRASEGSGPQETCVPMVIAPLFLIVPNTKQHEWSPTAEEIKLIAL